MGAIYEDVFFYLDLTKDMLKKKDVIKFLKLYIQEKNKINVKGHYGILIFQDEGNPIFIKDKKDSEIIKKAIEENWEARSKDISYFENGLFYIFSYIAETIRKKSKFNRVIIITDTPSDLSEGYQEALFELVSKIKIFPTFIDIIRVAESGQRFFKDDVKLNILASDTKGGIFYVHEKKGFQQTILKLVKNKQLVSTFTDKTDQFKISKEDYAFYSSLAKTLKAPQSWEDLKCNFCQETICPVCTDVYDVPHLCEECDAAFHNCCVVNHVIIHNIGIPHIFRCPSCDNLLKIDEDEIIEVSPEVSIEDPEIKSVKAYLEEEISELESPPKIIEVIDLEKSKQAPEDILMEESKKVGYSDGETKQISVGGFFGKTFTVKKVGDKLVYERITKSSNSQLEKIKQKDENPKYWKPSNNQITKKKRIKISTINVSYTGHKIGELFLKLSIELAIKNNISEIYMTHFTEEIDYLIDLIKEFGFRKEAVKKWDDGRLEDVYIKKIFIEEKEIKNLSPLEISNIYYPNFYDGIKVKKHIIPIRPEYHNRLFTDFPKRQTTLNEHAGKFIIEGNTIKKAYLCHAITKKIKPGSLLIFYRSHDIKGVVSLGVAEKIYYDLTTLEEVANIVGKRSVYSLSEIEEITQRSTTVILFNHHFYFKRILNYKQLVDYNILRGPPQSINEINHQNYLLIKEEGVLDERFAFN